MNPKLILANALIRASDLSFELDRDNFNCGNGICWMVDGQIHVLVPNFDNRQHMWPFVESWMKQQFMAWPEFSGDRSYPVPSPYPHITPMQAFGHGDVDFGIPKWKGKYGASRRRLFAFLLEQIAKEL